MLPNHKQLKIMRRGPLTPHERTLAEISILHAMEDCEQKEMALMQQHMGIMEKIVEGEAMNVTEQIRLHFQIVHIGQLMQAIREEHVALVLEYRELEA